jgi:hypothetical protein
MLDFNIDVDSSVYAKYYFELRGLAERTDHTFPLLPLSKEQAGKLEVRIQRGHTHTHSHFSLTFSLTFFSHMLFSHTFFSHMFFSHMFFSCVSHRRLRRRNMTL